MTFSIAWRGPYSTIASVSLMIACELGKELAKRDGSASRIAYSSPRRACGLYIVKGQQEATSGRHRAGRNLGRGQGLSLLGVGSEGGRGRTDPRKTSVKKSLTADGEALKFATASV